jgi:3-oxo-5-alpha-steroid 4-dehydrogenase 3
MYLNLNLFVIFWFITTFSVLILGVITVYFNQYLPQFISNLVKFGKLLNEQKIDSKNSKNLTKKLINLIEIPKKYFIHFYLFALIYILTIIILLFQTKCFSKSDQILCQLIKKLFNLIINRDVEIERKQLLSQRSLLLMVSLIIQFSRRLYETLFVSIYSETKINLIHYLVGFAFYTSCGFALIDSLVNNIEDNNYLSKLDLIIFIAFLFASYSQYKSHLILSELRIRRSQNGKQVINYSYSIPNGRLFDLVSCPNYFTEIVIYFCIYSLSHFNNLWAILVLWVLVNQTIAGLLTHEWYYSTFGDKYPKSRKAIFPHLL